MAIQETTTTWWPDMESVHDDFKDKVETATRQKLRKFREKHTLC